MPKKNIGEEIAKARENKGLSQRQLANAIGISNAEISKIESGEREIPNPKLFRKISKVIGLNYNDMMEMVGLGGKLTPLNPFIKKHYENLKGEELDYEWMLFRSSVKRNDDMIESLNEELTSNKLSEEEKAKFNYKLYEKKFSLKGAISYIVPIFIVFFKLFKVFNT